MLYHIIDNNNEIVNLIMFQRVNYMFLSANIISTETTEQYNSSLPPILLDSDELAVNAAKTLTALCEDLKLPYDLSMQT